MNKCTTLVIQASDSGFIESDLSLLSKELSDLTEKAGFYIKVNQDSSPDGVALAFVIVPT